MSVYVDDDHPAARKALEQQGAALPVTRRATKKAKRTKDTTSPLEAAFLCHWTRFAPKSLPAPQREVIFAPPRKWRADFGWPAERVLVECEGATFQGGRHTRGKGYATDCTKYNSAQADGWIVLRFTSDMLRDDPEGCIALVVDVLETRQRQQAMPRGVAAATNPATQRHNDIAP